MLDTIITHINQARHIVVLQADNPDADSLGSALALEAILSDQGKTVTMYCGVDIPGYLKYLTGWSRVVNSLPHAFDASIIVDTSSLSLFEKAVKSGEFAWLATKPCLVLDHHQGVENTIPNATMYTADTSSTAEIVYTLGLHLTNELPQDALGPIMTGILGDTQGLTNQLTTAQTYTIMADLVSRGADRPSLEEKRRQASKMHPAIYKYKGTLIERTTFSGDNAIADVIIPQQELNEYSSLYNPGPLIQPDILQTEGVQVGIVFKTYDSGKITAMIRCNAHAGIANKLAQHFGGDGHAFAAGFKITDGRPLETIRTECLHIAHQLLAQQTGLTT